MGVPDTTGTLREGEIFVAVSSRLPTPMGDSLPNWPPKECAFRRGRRDGRLHARSTGGRGGEEGGGCGEEEEWMGTCYILSGPCLVYRNPCLHVGKSSASYPPLTSFPGPLLPRSSHCQRPVQMASSICGVTLCCVLTPTCSLSVHFYRHLSRSLNPPLPSPSLARPPAFLPRLSMRHLTSPSCSQ